MKTFENTINKKFYFSSCEVCDAKCCKGINGTLYSQLLLEDFIEVYKNFPIVFMKGDLNYLKPVVLLTNGISSCRYLKEDNLCSIYEKRPSVCKVYPLSPHLTDTPFVDLSCPAIEDKGSLIVDNGVVNESFKHEVFESYQDKYIKMHLHFDKFNKEQNLEFFTKIHEIEFFRFKQNLGDEYIKMHLSSLTNFDSYFKV